LAVQGRVQRGSGLKHISVKKDGTGDFTEIQPAINSITDASASNRYVVDVYDDFVINNLTDLYKVANPTEKNTLANPTEAVSIVIGKSYVSVVGANSKKTLSIVSPINVAGTSLQQISSVYPKGNFSLKNFNVLLKGGRYAIHQDNTSLNSVDINAITTLEDLYVEHLGNQDHTNGASWTGVYAQANGISSGQSMIFKNCEWKASVGPIYIHNNVNFNVKSVVEFSNCKATLTSPDSLAGTETIYDGAMRFVDMGSGKLNTVTINNCNFFGFGIENSAWSGMNIANLSHDFRNGGADLLGSGNTVMKPAIARIKTLTFTASILNGTMSILNDSQTNTNSAYSSIWGETLLNYAGAVDAYAKACGTERIEEYVNGEKTFSIGRRLGDCSSINKTLTVRVNEIDHVVTFNSNYTNTSEADVLNVINAQLTTYAVASIGGFWNLQTFADTYEIGFNADAIHTVSMWGKAMVRDNSRGAGGWRVAQPGEHIEGISAERMNAWIAGNPSYGRILLKGKHKFGTVNPSIIYNPSVLGQMYKAHNNGEFSTTSILAYADFIGTGNSTLSWIT